MLWLFVLPEHQQQKTMSMQDKLLPVFNNELTTFAISVLNNYGKLKIYFNYAQYRLKVFFGHQLEIVDQWSTRIPPPHKRG